MIFTEQGGWTTLPPHTAGASERSELLPRPQRAQRLAALNGHDAEPPQLLASDAPVTGNSGAVIESPPLPLDAGLVTTVEG